MILSMTNNFNLKVPVGLFEVGTAVGAVGITVGVLVGIEGAADGIAVGILGIALGDATKM